MSLLARILQLLSQLRNAVADVTHQILVSIVQLWRQWLNLPRWIRWATYGALLGGLAVVCLPAIGFTAAGVAAGSLAAAWQSSIGIVSAGSLFAILQSLGATATVGTLLAALGVGGALGAAGGEVLQMN